MDADRIRLAVSGSVAIAPPGTIGPNSATSKLSPVWKHVGFISDAGVTESVKGDPSEIVPWRSSRVARVSPGVTGVEYKFVMLETNAVALQAFYGGKNLAGKTWHHLMPETAVPAAVVCTMIDGNKVTRRWVPSGVFDATGDVEFTTGSPSSYEVTLTAFPVEDSMGDGLVSRAVAFYSEPIPDGAVA